MGSSPISFSYIDVDSLVTDELVLSDWLCRVAREESCFMGRLGYHFCSDEHLLEMNRQHLDHDFYTDVITFDESRLPLLSGDVFISVDRVRENAEKMGHDTLLELYRVMVHGLFHLIGYGDKDEAEKELMRSKETQALRLLH